MHITIKSCIFALLSIALLNPILTLAAENPSPSGDPFIGSYEGTYNATGYDPYEATGHVTSEGPELYRLIVNFAVGAKGNQQHSQLELHGRAQGSRLRFAAYSGNVMWEISLEDGTLNIQRYHGYGGTFKLKKVIHVSPTEGLTPPEGATILLPFTTGEKADISAWTNTEWQALNDGVMRVKGGSGDNRTQESFGSFRLHLEFKTAHMPSAHGQQRSNSGIYYQDRYETQILDSFGLISGSGDCGGIYGQSTPLVNVCFPPAQWQTYDAEFTAAEFDEAGKAISHPRITVKLNGVLIQDNHELKASTVGAVDDKHVPIAPLRLQDHGNPVEYRNIWLVER